MLALFYAELISFLVLWNLLNLGVKITGITGFPKTAGKKRY